MDKFKDLAFYFHNDRPNPDTNSPVSTVDFEESFNVYQNTYYPSYKSKADAIFKDTLSYCKSNPSYCNDNKVVNEFWNNVIVDNYNAIKDPTTGLTTSILNLVKEKNATVNITLIGSASAPAKENYNVNLSSRRIDSVRQYLLKDLKEYASKITINGTPIDKPAGVSQDFAKGETLVIPISKAGTNGRSVNCNSDIKSGNGQVTSDSQIYSVDAMACRRVRFEAKVTIPPVESNIDNQTNQPVVEPPKTIETTLVTPQKPKPTVTIEQKLKEGIGKKILRQLLSECDYFELIKEEVPMLYDSIREKIKYFNPAFHSMTPEGLNARLTFLNQCVRPGETIPVIGPDGKPKYDNAVNTSFGAPPVLILRIGDFYNGKIIPKSVGFTYEPLVFDMNPEGIGIQPMIANVSMSFDFIGGHGLAKPVEQLQNALSFNYYANTEIYDERSVWTDDSFQKIDKALITELLKNDPLETLNNVDNPPQNGFGDTIGTILNYNNVPSGQTGEMSYQTFMDKVLGSTPEYLITLTNKLESVTSQFNYGILQMLNQKRNYTIGNIYQTGNEDEILLYGKPSIEESGTNGKNVFTVLFDSVREDVTNDTNPIIKYLIDNYNDLTANDLTNIKKNINSYVTKLNTMSNDVQTIINDICVMEQNYVSDFKKMELINGGPGQGTPTPIDGKKLETGLPLVYYLTVVDDNFNELRADIEKVYLYYDKVNDLLVKDEIITDTYTSTGDFKLPKKSKMDDTVENKKFYMVVSSVFIDENKLNDFKTYVLNTNLTPSNKLKNKFDKIVDDLAKQYKQEHELEVKLFADFKLSQGYKKLTDGVVEELYPAGKERIIPYTTVPNNDQTIQTKSEDRLKALFSDKNSVTNNKYFIESDVLNIVKMN